MSVIVFVDRRVVVVDGMRADDGKLDELYRLAYFAAFAVLRDRYEAEECAQEAAARALAQWRKVAGYARPWVVRVSANLAIGVLRRQDRLTVGLPDELRPVLENDLDEAVVAGIDVRAALLRLPTRQREAVVMRYLAGITEADVALAMGCSVGTVKTHTRRGLETLRSYLHPRLES